MPRANRHWLSGHVWHITHRCHRQQFLLKFARDRRLWRRWLFEARQRFGLCVLDFIVTSNHIHLLVQDRSHDEIAKSMQLIALKLITGENNDGVPIVESRTEKNVMAQEPRQLDRIRDCFRHYSIRTGKAYLG